MPSVAKLPPILSSRAISKQAAQADRFVIVLVLLLVLEEIDHEHEKVLN
jgi:hypothetical protein